MELASAPLVAQTQAVPGSGTNPVLRYLESTLSVPFFFIHLHVFFFKEVLTNVSYLYFAALHEGLGEDRKYD